MDARLTWWVAPIAHREPFLSRCVPVCMPAHLLFRSPYDRYLGASHGRPGSLSLACVLAKRSGPHGWHPHPSRHGFAACEAENVGHEGT
jgi:hypothetical protein